MAPARTAVRLTSNFEATLEQIAAFLTEQRGSQAYASLLDDLGNNVIPNLEQHPRIGRGFFARAGQSVEVRERVAALRKRLGDAEIREYLSGGYVLLYGLFEAGGARRSGPTVYLLAIRHHRQLSFDFERLWLASRGDV